MPKCRELNGAVKAYGGRTILKFNPNLQSRVGALVRYRSNRMNRRTTTMAMLGLTVVFAAALPQIGFAQNNPFLAACRT
jgi:hypothetical protein